MRTNGADRNDCLSLAKACQTIQGAVYRTQPGDTVSIAAGDYTKMVWVSHAGAKGNFITYDFAKGARVVANPADNNPFLFDIAVPWIRVQNGEFVGTLRAYTYKDAKAAYTQGKPPKNLSINQVCLMVRASHVQVLGNHVHDCSGAGIGAQDVDDVSISGNVVERTNWWSSYDGSGIDVHYGRSPKDGEPVRGFTVLNNTVRDSANAIPYYADPAGAKPTDGNGIIADLMQGHEAGYPGRVLIQGNIIERSGGSGIRAYRSVNVDMVKNSSFGSGRCPVAGADCGAQKNGEINYNFWSGNAIGNTTPADAGNYAAFFYYSRVAQKDNVLRGIVRTIGTLGAK